MDKQNHNIPKGRQHPSNCLRSGSLEPLKTLSSYEPNALSVDWRLPFADIREGLGDTIILQGNINFRIISSKIQEKVKTLYADRTKVIANLGHGLLPLE